MKRVVLLISLVHLLLAISSPCTNANDVVLDTKGEIVRADTKYFVVGALRGYGGGGVRRGPTYDAKLSECTAGSCCPSKVVQSLEDDDLGMPVYFEPVASKDTQIKESTNIVIKFFLRNPSICNNTVWNVDESSFLSTNGNRTKADSWFQIKKVDDLSYKFVYPPSNSNVDYTISNRVRRLCLSTNDAFKVVFVKDTLYGINSII